MNLLTEKTLPDAVEMASFQLIWKIHDELRTEGRADCVPGFLVDLVEGGYGYNFLIPYVYIVRKLPDDYERIFLNFLCYSDELPALFDKLRLFPSDVDAISPP